MATRLQYRTNLKEKLTALVDSDAGDFDFSDGEYNIFLELSLARLFPSLYQRKTHPSLPVTAYGSGGGMGAVTGIATPDRVYMVENASERTPVSGWQSRAESGEVVGIPIEAGTVNVHYFAAVLMPNDDLTNVPIGDEYMPLVIQGAIIEALETVQEVPARNAQQALPTMSAVLDRVIARYERLKDSMAMSLPVVVL